MNLREIENQISNLRVRSYKYEKKVRELEDKVQDLETKTASDLSQSLVAESATGEEQDCLWLARSKSGRLYSFTAKPEKSLNGEHWNGRNILYWGMSQYKSLTYENSPQKLVLETAISKTEIVEKSGQDAFTELRALLDEAEKDNREKYPDESMMTSILQRMREVIE
jgi:hypothetical protein